MILELDMASEIPIYQQVYDGVVLGIASGVLTMGEALPPVRQLAVDIGINMHTVNKAYSLLRQDGFIQLHRRDGAVISPDAAPSPADIARISALVTSAAAQAKAKAMAQEDFLALCGRLYDALKGA